MSYNSSFCSEYSKQYAYVSIESSNRSDGKKFATWAFRSVDGKKETVDVQLITKTGSMVFSAYCGLLGETLTNENPNELRNEILRLYNERIHVLSDIKWEDWLEVKVYGQEGDFYTSGKSGRGYGSGLGSELKITVNEIKRGVHKDGGVFTIHSNNVLIPFPTNKRYNENSDDRMFSRNTDTEVTYIPKTDKNLKALRLLAVRLTELRIKLADSLSQESIEDSIKKIDNLLLLQ